MLSRNISIPICVARSDASVCNASHARLPVIATRGASVMDCHKAHMSYLNFESALEVDGRVTCDEASHIATWQISGEVSCFLLLALNTGSCTVIAGQSWPLHWSCPPDLDCIWRRCSD